ncbi:MAG: hypothetical protein KDK44_02780 [Chlamydiia bacterium]|nr:hypothetical protein [Chlamydiia bacterium]
MSANAIKFPGKTILLHAFGLGGLGDLTAVARIAQILAHRGTFDPKSITVACSQKKSYKFLKSLNLQNLKLLPLPDDHAAYVEATKDYDVQITYPDCQARLPWIINCVPTLLLNENNYRVAELPEPITTWCLSQSLGLPDESENSYLGILIDPDLRSFSQLSQEAKGQELKATFEALDPDLKQKIYQNQSPEDCMVFLGYCHDQQLRFNYMQEIVALYQDQSKQLCFVMPDYFSLHRDNGVVYETVNDRSVRIVIADIPPTQMNHLWKLSMPEVLVTGDQSLTEAISINKVVLRYEVMDHKKRFGQAWKRLSIQHTAEEICQAYDCSEKIEALIGQLLTSRSEAQSAVSHLTQPVIQYHNDPFPLSLPVFITSSQVQKLRLTYDEQKPEDPEFQARYPTSILACWPFGGGIFLTKRSADTALAMAETF